MDCEICTIAQDDRLLLTKSEHWRATLAPDQKYLGRTYVALRRHTGDIVDLTTAEQLDFFNIAKYLESAFRAAFDATLFNWACLMNNAYQSKPYNPHVHWHLRPRYDHPVSFAGETFIDEQFGHHHEYGNPRVLEQPALEEIRAAIASRL